ncbi:MAG: hypothetical protein ACJA1R_002830, partial [Flavobacteriales bacterium]
SACLRVDSEVGIEADLICAYRDPAGAEVFPPSEFDGRADGGTGGDGGALGAGGTGQSGTAPSGTDGLSGTDGCRGFAGAIVVDFSSCPHTL